MSRQAQNAIGSITCSLLIMIGIATPALAVDGVIEINQARALAGGVTPGDTPGFPVTISQSGSYRLTGNLTIEAVNVDGIQVEADNVTIDLNGFTIAGPTVCSYDGTSVTCSPYNPAAGILNSTHRYCTVSNGSIKGMGYGLQLAFMGRGEKVHATSNARIGIYAVVGSSVTGSIASYNGEYGIYVNAGLATANTAAFNGLYGLYMNGGGYSNNILFANNGVGTEVYSSNAVQTGANVCNNAPCP